MSNLVAMAEAFARAAHEGQVRRGAAAEPYAVHLAEVAALVAGFGGSDGAVMAAWLHDTVEDCGALPAELEAQFGADVAGFVAELTDDGALEKPERKRMQLVNAPGKSPEAALVKACDKLSNIRALEMSPPVDWPQARKAAYLDWAEQVVGLLPAGADPVREVFAQQLIRSRAAI